MENQHTWLGMDRDIWESVLIEYGNFERSEIKSLPNLFKAKQLKLHSDYERAEVIDFHQRLQIKKSKESNMGRNERSFEIQSNIKHTQNYK